MAPSDSALRYRPTALDRALASERTVAVVGPVVGLDEDHIRANLAAARADAPGSRIALSPSVGARSWPYRVDIVDQAVIRRSSFDAADLGGLLTEIHGRGADRGPLNVFICGDYLVVDYSHGIGDGQLGVMLLAALSGDVDASRARILSEGLPRNATWSALWRHYRARPAAVQDFLRLRRCSKQYRSDSSVGRREILGSNFAKQSRTAYMPPDRVTALRTWAKAHEDGATTASVTVALWVAALRAAGVSVDDQITMLINCRRYLDPKHQLAQGNFAVALPLLIPRPQTPVAISEAVRSVVDSGWPIAILAMAELKSRITRTVVPTHPVTVTVPDRLRIAVSDLGRLGMFDDVTWGPGAPPQVAAYLEPDGPDAASLLVSEIAGGRTFTASFCGGMVDSQVIARALDGMCDDPVGTLQTAYE